MKRANASTSFTPGAVSKRLFKSIPASLGWLTAAMPATHSGPIPPLRRNGRGPSYASSRLQSNLLPLPPRGFALGVKEQHVGHTGISRALHHILACGDTKRLDYPYAALRLRIQRIAQSSKLPHALVAVHLHTVQSIRLDGRNNFILPRIDKHPHLERPSPGTRLTGRIGAQCFQAEPATRACGCLHGR